MPLECGGKRQRHAAFGGDCGWERARTALRLALSEGGVGARSSLCHRTPRALSHPSACRGPASEHEVAQRCNEGKKSRAVLGLRLRVFARFVFGKVILREVRAAEFRLESAARAVILAATPT